MIASSNRKCVFRVGVRVYRGCVCVCVGVWIAALGKRRCENCRQNESQLVFFPSPFGCHSLFFFVLLLFFFSCRASTEVATHAHQQKTFVWQMKYSILQQDEREFNNIKILIRLRADGGQQNVNAKWENEMRCQLLTIKRLMTTEERTKQITKKRMYINNNANKQMNITKCVDDLIWCWAYGKGEFAGVLSDYGEEKEK